MYDILFVGAAYSAGGNAVCPGPSTRAHTPMGNVVRRVVNLVGQVLQQHEVPPVSVVGEYSVGVGPSRAALALVCGSGSIGRPFRGSRRRQKLSLQTLPVEPVTWGP